MARGTTFGTFIGLGRETVLGTTVARSLFLAPLSESIRLVQPYQDSKELNSPSTQRMTRVGGRMSQGPMRFTMSYEGLETLLKDSLGAVATTDLGAGSGPYQHDFTLATDLPSPGLSVEAYRRGAAFLHADCKINKATFNFRPGEEVTAEFEVLGLEATTPSASTPSYTDLIVVVCDAISVLTLDGSTVDLDEAQIVIDNGLVVQSKLGSLLGREPLRGKHREVSGRLVKDFEEAGASSPYAKYLAGTAAALVVTATGALISGSDYYKFTLSIPTLIFSDASPLTEGPGIRKQQLPFRARQNSTANDELTAQLVNTVASVT